MAAVRHELRKGQTVAVWGFGSSILPLWGKQSDPNGGLPRLLDLTRTMPPSA